MTNVLPSWADGDVRHKILDFVKRVTSEGSHDFVEASDRIAVFDNDGTLWCEQPLPVQGFFTFDRVKELVSENPTLKQREPFRAVAENDRQAIEGFGKRELFELMCATHAGMTTDAFESIAETWFAAARHPRFARPFTECAYQPMLELLSFLRQNGFWTFIVSGGGIDFIRAFAERTYGIPAHQVVGSSGKTKTIEQDGHLDLLKLPELGSFDDGEGKVENIELHIGKRPIFAFGNSDGDLPMLRYAASGPRPSVSLLLHHDDDEREFAYDREFAVSPLAEGLTEAAQRGWLVSMKSDFRRVFS